MAAKLALGSKGRVVSDLQKLLNDKAKLPSKIDVDGVFGDTTDEAVRLFQKRSKLRVDGIVGPEMGAALALLGGTAAAAFAKETGAEPADDGQEKPSILITANGKQYAFTKPEFEEFRKQMVATLKRTAVLAAHQRAGMARSLWNDLSALNDDQYVVAWFVRLAGPTLPIAGTVSASDAAYAKLESAVNGGDFKQIQQALAAAEKPINAAYKAMWDYQSALVGHADAWIGGLEFTKTVSFVVVGAIGAPVAAGAGAGAAAAAAVAGGGAALIESSATEFGRGVAGSGSAKGAAINIVRDVVIGASVGAFLKSAKGVKLVESAGKLVVEKLSGKWLARVSSKTLQEFVGKFLKNAGEKGLEAFVDEAAKTLTFKTSPDEFAGNLAKAIAVGGILGGLDKWIDSKFAERVVAKMSAATRTKVFGKIDAAKEVELIRDLVKGPGGKVLEKALEAAFGAATGSETAEKIGEDAAARFASSAEFKRLEGEIAKRVEKRK